MSKIIKENNIYIVCLTKAGLIVQTKATNKGKCLMQNYEAWQNCFSESLDNVELNALCKNFLKC